MFISTLNPLFHDRSKSRECGIQCIICIRIYACICMQNAGCLLHNTPQKSSKYFIHLSSLLLKELLLDVQARCEFNGHPCWKKNKKYTCFSKDVCVCVCRQLWRSGNWLLLLFESCNVRAFSCFMALRGSIVWGRDVYVPSIFHHRGEPLSPLTHTWTHKHTHAHKYNSYRHTKRHPEGGMLIRCRVRSPTNSQHHVTWK